MDIRQWFGQLQLRSSGKGTALNDSACRVPIAYYTAIVFNTSFRTVPRQMSISVAANTFRKEGP